MDFNERVRRKNEFDASLVYGTKKFNQLTGRDKHISFRKNNDLNWVNAKTNLVDEKFIQKRNCPLCKSNDYSPLFVKAGFPHVKCNVCSLVYVNPILNEHEYKKLWSAEDSWEVILENPEQVKMQLLEANYSMDIVQLYLKNDKASFCDVGCGPGTLLVEAKKRGYSVYGIEPNKRCHKQLDQKGIPFTGDFFPLKENVTKTFDCVFLLNTLEHLHDPLNIVKEVKKLIKPKGYIYISVPHIDSFVSRLLREKAGVFGGHSHIQFFSHITLSNLLQKTGFEVIEYETIITEIGVIKNYLSFEDPYFGDGKDRLDFITPEFLYKNNIARNLNILAMNNN